MWEKLSVWWVCFRKIDFAFDAIAIGRGERKGRTTAFCFVIFFLIGKKISPCFTCAHTRSILFQPLCSCSHTPWWWLPLPAVCSGLVLCCFVTDFRLKPHTAGFPGSNSAFLIASPPGSFYQAGAVDQSPKGKRPSLYDGGAEKLCGRARPEGFVLFLHSPLRCAVFPHLSHRLMVCQHRDVKCPTSAYFKTV